MTYLIAVLHVFKFAVAFENLFHLDGHFYVFRQNACAVHLKLGVGEARKQCVKTFSLIAGALLALGVKLAAETNELFGIEIRFAHILHGAVQRQGMVCSLKARFQSPIIVGQYIGGVRIVLFEVLTYGSAHVGIGIVHKQSQHMGLHIIESRIIIAAAIYENSAYT